MRWRGFWALFVVQALGAVNDNLFKNALVVLALYRVGHLGPVLVALSGGVFLLPYALFSAVAGQVADGFEKARVVRLVKWWELGLMVLAGFGFVGGSVGALFAVLFGLGVQAAFFSPVKYGILPDLLADEGALVRGNGLVEAGTFVGILLGTVAGGALVLGAGGGFVVSAACLAVAGLGVAAAYGVPFVGVAQPGLRVRANFLGETWVLLREARGEPDLWFAVLGISWFWALGASLLAEFPTVARDELGANAHVVTLMFAVFAVGVGVGSLAVARLGRVVLGVVVAAGVGVSAFTADFAWGAMRAGVMADVPAMLARPAGWHMLADLFALAVFGGAFSVPLYVLLQEHSAPSHRARMVGANNVMNAIASVLAAGVMAGLYAAGLRAPAILLLLAAGNLGVAWWVWRYARGKRKALLF